MTDGNQTDWAAWSRGAVADMQQRNNTWIAQYSLGRTPYQWDLERATLTFERSHDNVVADVVVVATASAAEGTVLAAWANDKIPDHCRRGLEIVREFGRKHDLTLLTNPSCQGGRAEGLELLAIAGRLLDAPGVFIDGSGDLTYFLVLSNSRGASRSEQEKFRTSPKAAA